MSMDIYFATPPVTNPNASIASVALKHGLNANLVSRWIRNFHHHDGVVQYPAHVKGLHTYYDALRQN